MTIETATLRDAIAGTVLLPGDAGYEAARLGGGTTPVDDRFPDVIVQPRTADDVAQAVRFARDQALAISVRSGGHDMIGSSTGADGLLLDLALLNGVEVDAAAGTAVVGGGTRAGELIAAAAPYDYMPIVGMSNNVGVGGITLGGGIGWSCGTDGAVVDNLLAAEVVTADGQILTASPQENPDLFWAIRGGGGNFGVVTSFTFKMTKQPTILAGVIVQQAEPKAMLRFIGEYMDQSPDELDIGLLISPGAQPTFIFAFVWVGDEEAGQRALDPVREFAPVLNEDVKVQSFQDFMTSMDLAPHMYVRAGALERLDDAAIDAMATVATTPGPAGCTLTLGHYMHGALCRVPEGDTPLLRTPGKVLFNMHTTWSGDETPADALRWVNEGAEVMRKVHSPREYINYLSHDDVGAVRDAYGPHYDRLVELKRRYDPENVFSGNRNIVP